MRHSRRSRYIAKGKMHRQGQDASLVIQGLMYCSAGAEVIRMMATILGTDGFRKGTDLYFERHDGQAVTCDDFVAAMEDATGEDFTQFKRWYSQAGMAIVRAR